jgi:RecB family exonuclease
LAAIYSYSKLTAFNDCPRNYYYTYIKGLRGGESIYSYLGTAAHDLAEAIDLGQIDNAIAVERFNAAVEDAEMVGLTWISDKARINYIECVTHFLQDHQPSDNPNLKIEDVFAVTIGDIVLYGFIDKWYRTEDTIYIIDYKTSSKFSAKDLPHKKLQLYTYAEALQRYYPGYKIIIQYNMMKYALVGKTLKPRNELSIGIDYGTGLLSFEYDEQCRQELIDFVTSTVNAISECDPEKESDWQMLRNPKSDFFCQSLCSHCSRCNGEIA